MAVRWRRVEPDQIMETRDGQEIAVVSDEAFYTAVLHGAQVVAFAGGAMGVTVKRAPTGVPNEMVTIEALIEWKNMVDAKPEPEPAVVPPAVETDPTPEELEERLEAESAEEEFLREAEQGEDESSMEPAAR